MTAPIKVLIVSILTLLWFLFSHWMYSPCYHCNQMVDQGPLLFEWNNADGITNEKFAAYKQGLVGKCAEGEVLEITGYYFPEEKNTSTFSDLGLARANDIKELLQPEVEANRIVLRSAEAVMPTQEEKNPQNAVFEAAEFNCKKGIPLYSNWTKGAALQGAGFAAYYTNIIAQRKDDEQLEIVGLYYEDEENTTTFANLGLARANQVKEMFLKDVPEDKTILTSRKITERDGVRANDFLSAEVSWREGARSLEELDDRVVIRFPFNSVKKDFDPAVETYLTKLAEKLKKEGGKIELTGHTDNIGSEASNEKLGMRRAKVVRDVLRKKGVKRSQIITISKGETDPVASNDTEEGRHENRRTEVRMRK